MFIESDVSLVQLPNRIGDLREVASNFGFTRVGRFRDGDLSHFLNGHNGFVAGGAFKAIYSEYQHCNEINLYFRNKDDFNEPVDYYKSYLGAEILKEDEDEIVFIFFGMKSCISLSRKMFGTPAEILDSFAFTITQYAFYRVGNTFKTLKNSDFEKDVKSRSLNYHGNFNGEISFSHLMKYVALGYMAEDSLIAEVVESFFESHKDRFPDSSFKDMMKGFAKGRREDLSIIKKGVRTITSARRFNMDHNYKYLDRDRTFWALVMEISDTYGTIDYSERNDLQYYRVRIVESDLNEIILNKFAFYLSGKSHYAYREENRLCWVRLLITLTLN